MFEVFRRGVPSARRFRDALHRRREWLVLGAVACFGCALVVAAFQPGIATRDSHVQLEQARAFAFEDNHPPMMALVWHFLDRLSPGFLGMLVFTNGLYWTGLAAFFRYLRGSLLLRAVLLLVVGWFPPVLAILGTIWKDNLMQAGLIAGLGALLGYVYTRHWAWLVPSLVFFFLGITVRHNGIGAALPLLFLLPYESGLLRGRAFWLRFVVAMLVAFAVVMGLRTVGELVTRPFTSRTEYWQTVFIYDLAGMSVHAGEVLVDDDVGILRKGADLRDIRAVYSTVDHLKLYKCRPRGRCTPVFDFAPDEAHRKKLVRNWRRAVWAHAGAYLEHRTRVFGELIGTSHRPAGPIPGTPRHAKAGAPFSEQLRDGALELVHAFKRTPLFAIWLYALIECALVLFGLYRAWKGRSALPFALAASGALYLFTFFLSTGAPDFRYGVWTILTTLLATISVFLARERSANAEVTVRARDVEPASHFAVG